MTSFIVIVFVFLLLQVFLFKRKLEQLYERVAALEKRMGVEGVKEPESEIGEEVSFDGAPPVETTPEVSPKAEPRTAYAGVVSEGITLVERPVEEELPDTPAEKQEWSEERIGKWIGIAGLAAIVLGVGFFIQYAFQNEWIGETARVVLGIIAGLSFLLLGQYLFGRYHVYAQIVSATGILLLYLSIFSAFVLYELIGTYEALAYIFVVTVLGAVVSIFRSASSLAYLSVVGGFVIPGLITVLHKVGPLFGALLIYFFIISALAMSVSAVGKFKNLAVVGFVGGFIIPVFMTFGVNIGHFFNVLLVYFIIVTALGMAVSGFVKFKSLSLMVLSVGFAVPLFMVAGYSGFDPLVILVFILAVSVMGLILGFRENFLPAVLGSVAGAFVVPFPIFVANIDASSSILLSAYILLVTGASFAISYVRSWRSVDYISIVGTIILSLVVIGGKELPFFVHIFFLTVYFLLLGLIVFARLFAGKALADEKSVYLSVLITAFYTGCGVYLLQVFNLTVFQGYFVFLVAVLYFILSLIAYNTRREDNLLFLMTLGLGLVSLSLAVPLQFSGAWITLAWIFQASVLLYIAIASKLRPVFFFSIILIAVATLKVLYFDVPRYGKDAFTPIFNWEFLVLVILTAALAWFALLIYRNKQVWEIFSVSFVLIAIFAVSANLFALGTMTFEVWRYYESRIYGIEQVALQERGHYEQLGQSEREREVWMRFKEEETKLDFEYNMVISILWALYSIVLIIFGFVMRNKFARLLGAAFLAVTAFNVFFNVWQLGGVYRIMSYLVFGSLALLISFLYAKYKNYFDEKIF